MATNPVPISQIVDEISSTLEQQETGSGTTGVGVSQNNPGALKYSLWESIFGATSGSGGFAQFPSLSEGYKALQQWVSTAISNNNSLSSLLNTFAPPSDNNTNNTSRLAQLAQATGLDPTTSIGAQIGAFGTAIAQEANTVPSGSDVVAGLGGVNSVSKIFGLELSRVVFLVIGVVFLIIGLSMLKQTKVIVNPIINTAKESVKRGATVAEASTVA